MKALLQAAGRPLPRRYKNDIKSTVAALHRLIPVERAAPRFLIVGAQKAGTSSLFDYLQQHEAFRAPLLKDIYFFDREYGRGIDWYLSHFPPQKVMERTARRCGSAATGEGATYYLFHPWAPERVRTHFPEMKIIALLRDPVKRAISHYHHNRRMGRERASLLEALQLEEERTAAETAQLEADPDHVSDAHQHFSYLARGRYAPQIRRWRSQFPEDQLLIMCSEAFFADPDMHFRRVCAFIGIDEMRLPAYQPRGRGEYERPSEEAIAYARAAMREPNRELFEVVGETWPWLS